jgi:hypothetical protein
MDLSAVLQPISRFWYFVPLVLMITIFRSSWFKGRLWGGLVNVSPSPFLNKDRYRPIKNVTLQLEVGVAQVKQAFVSKHRTFLYK